MKENKIINYILLIGLFFTSISCKNTKDEEMQLLMGFIDTYETAWANNDFLTVESFFTEDAKRLHTEPYVWDRAEIKRYFEDKATKANANISGSEDKTDWKAGRTYIEIRIEGNIAYDIFTTERFKALHIWEKQKDGAWKIKYDMSMLNHIEEKKKNSYTDTIP